VTTAASRRWPGPASLNKQSIRYQIILETLPSFSYANPKYSLYLSEPHRYYHVKSVPPRLEGSRKRAAKCSGREKS
jgi:hypothetical protein